MSAGKRKSGGKNRLVKPKPAQMEAKRRRRLRIFAIFGVLFSASIFSMLAVLTYAWMTQAPMFSARFVLVSGNDRLNHSEVLSAADIQSGDNIFGVNLELAQARLGTHPWVDTASVMREFPNRIIIRVTEHSPVAVVELGRRYLMNGRGELFARAEDLKLELPQPVEAQDGEEAEEKKVDPDGGLPRFEGIQRGSLPVAGIPELKPEGKIWAAVQEILPIVQDLKKSPGRFEIKAVQIDADRGLNLVTTGVTEKIRLGFGNYRQKLSRIDRMFSFLETQMKRENKETLNAVESVDARDIDSVVIKPATS